MTPHAHNKHRFHGELAVIPTTCEPTFVVEGPAHHDYVENAPAHNRVIAQDFDDHNDPAFDRPLMRRAWFTESALADTAQVFGGGN